jgi:division protein CdvB (Snf7/Vps24/ESCRT-III family)
LVDFGAIAVVFTKYYTSVGSRKLHRRINNVKLDLESARHRLKEVREDEYEMTRSEESTIQRVRFAKEVIDELQLRLTLADDSVPVVMENKGVALLF